MLKGVLGYCCKYLCDIALKSVQIIYSENNYKYTFNTSHTLVLSQVTALSEVYLQGVKTKTSEYTHLSSSPKNVNIFAHYSQISQKERDIQLDSSSLKVSAN